MGITRWQRILIVGLCLYVCFAVPLGSVLAAQPSTPPADTQLPQISLAGQWQFYWGQLLTPADFTAPSGGAPKGGMIAVPSSWVGQVLGPNINGGQPLPSFGVATYRTQVILSPDKVDTYMMLLLESVGSAYRIWVNGELVGSLGSLATHTSTSDNNVEVPQIRVNLLNITPKTKQLDIIVQVSNYSFRESGIFGDVRIDQPDATVRYVFNHYILQDLLLIGVLVVVGLYHVMVYFLSRRESELLWLAGACLVTAVRAILLNKFLIHLLLPDVSWTILMYMQYSAKFIALFMYIQLIRSIYRQDVNELVHKICVAVLLGGALYVISVPPRIFTLTFNIQTLITVVILFYYLVVVGYTLHVQNREGVRLKLGSILFIIIAIIHDYYLYTNRLQSVQMVPYAILMALLTQAMIISYRYTRFQQRNAQLALDLQDTNRNLEEKVIARTDDLNTSNAKLVALTNQRSLLMTNIAHDMGSPMLGVQSSLHLLTTEALNAKETQYLFTVLTERVNYVKQLIDDLFRLAKLESRQIEFDWEDCAVGDLYTEMNASFGQIVQAQGRMLIGEHVATHAFNTYARVRVDRRQLYRVLQNLIDNALKYSPDPLTPIAFTSVVRQSITAESPGYEWRVEVVDQGVGIAAEHLPKIFERFYTRSNGLQAGSGLGLAICKEIVERHGGVIGAQSEQGHGSAFFFTLPLVP
jgi:signal transduction histidine kinase